MSQREDGVWEVVDGLQRLSTILEFIGELRDLDGKAVAPSSLVGTTYLPSLHGRSFDTGTNPLDPGQRINFKRAKLDIKIVKEAEEATTKYDLFDRLNSGGSVLSDQEFRNSLIVMSNPDFMDWLEKLRRASYGCSIRSNYGLCTLGRLCDHVRSSPSRLRVWTQADVRRTR